ncbi:MAG: potassium transporter KefB [Sphingobacteriaceae bacterium]|nr:MAG: potassium transporter KefB [Sphingobacteriaceae bacterium]
MTAKNNLTAQPFDTSSLKKCMLTGAGIAFIAISVFVIGAGQGEPAWGDYWMIKPLLLTPAIGALGGGFFHMVLTFFSNNRWNKAVAVILGVIGFIIIFWIGMVLGLNGTMWD